MLNVERQVHMSGGVGAGEWRGGTRGGGAEGERERKRERERERARALLHSSGGRVEGDRENLRQAPRSSLSPMQGSIPRPWNHDLSRNQKLVPQLTESPRCP